MSAGRLDVRGACRMRRHQVEPVSGGPCPSPASSRPSWASTSWTSTLTALAVVLAVVEEIAIEAMKVEPVVGPQVLGARRRLWARRGGACWQRRQLAAVLAVEGELAVDAVTVEPVVAVEPSSATSSAPSPIAVVAIARQLRGGLVSCASTRWARRSPAPRR